MTLAIGFGDGRGRRARRAGRSLRARLRAARARYAAGWAALPRVARRRRRQRGATRTLRRSTSSRCSCSPRRRTSSNRGAVDRGAEHAVDVGHADARARPTYLRPLPPRLAARPLPRRHRARRPPATTPARGRLLDYLWRVQKPDGSFWQNTCVNGKENWTSQQLDEDVAADRARLVARAARGADRLGARREGRRLHRRATAADRDQERWENQSGYSPNTIADRDRRADLRGRHRARATATRSRRRRYEAVADDWQANVEGWTATTNGPYSPKPYYLRLTKDAQPERRARPTTSATTTRAGRPAQDRRPDSFLGLVLFGRQALRTTRRSSTRWRSATTKLGVRHADRDGLAPLHVRRLRRADERRRLGPVLRQAGGPDARARCGRCWPASAASTSCSPGASASRAPAHDRRHRERRPDAARAGVGRPPAARRDAGEGTRSATPLRVDARAVRAARVVDRRRQAGRAPVDRRLSLHEGGLLRMRQLTTLDGLRQALDGLLAATSIRQPAS